MKAYEMMMMRDPLDLEIQENQLADLPFPQLGRETVSLPNGRPIPLILAVSALECNPRCHPGMRRGILAWECVDCGDTPIDIV
ncbi:hypothetical protein FJTKL_12052 [Diaporthe vaccinii]|uniref:Uncharacterized protein n=1 Tax=Diaporthe vaccinii TaxID=105482 RepID=A0ABR4FB11_9PEZI